MVIDLNKRNSNPYLKNFMKLIFVSFIIISSCNNSEQPKVNPNSTAAENTTKTGKETTSNTKINDSIINIRFPRDSTWVTVNGKMKGVNHPVTVYIPVKQGRHLTVSVSPEDMIANVRINQLFTPDGKADGPFGRELKTQLHQQGTYKLIIAENMMQGDEWKGNFKLTIKVE